MWVSRPSLGLLGPHKTGTDIINGVNIFYSGVSTDLLRFLF